MKSILIRTALVAAAFGAAVPLASAQCTDSRITTGFQSTVRRAPTAAECTNLVAASKVCQDPWIAQAYYVLSVSTNPGLLLNGHSPTQLDSGRAGSTQNQCNYTNYGSWPDFTTLIGNVNKYLHPVAPPPAAGVAVSLGLPGVMQNAQPVAVSWTYTGTPSTCGSGLALVLNGSGLSNYTWSRITSLTSAKSMSIPMLDWSKSMKPGQYPVQVTLLDLCTGKTVSATYTSAIGIPAPVITPPPTSTPTRVMTDSQGYEYCFGAVGIQCTGAATWFQQNIGRSDIIEGLGCGPTARGADGQAYRNCFVAAGSIKHDNCCSKNPTGVMCGGSPATNACQDQCNSAVYDVLNGRTWTETIPEGPDELTPTASQRLPPAEAYSTSVHLRTLLSTYMSSAPA